eukprot:scaffold11275_cov108-Isochrysis_galbana.AAC.6
MGGLVASSSGNIGTAAVAIGAPHIDHEAVASSPHCSVAPRSTCSDQNPSDVARPRGVTARSTLEDDETSRVPRNNAAPCTPSSYPTSCRVPSSHSTAACTRPKAPSDVRAWTSRALAVNSA